MKKTLFKLTALHLALLMMLLLALPVCAQTQADTYYISVNGKSFRSDRDSAVAGSWAYSGADKTLVLYEYNGGSIRASGDLTVYVEDSARIQGKHGIFGEDGIVISNGNLVLIQATGSSLQIYGGHCTGSSLQNFSSGPFPGSGIAVEDGALGLLQYEDATARIQGGTNYGKNDDCYGGDAAWAQEVYLSLNGRSEFIGGESIRGYGGTGLTTGYVLAEVHDQTEFTGGRSTYGYGGEGIWAYQAELCSEGKLWLTGGNSIRNIGGEGLSVDGLIYLYGDGAMELKGGDSSRSSGGYALLGTEVMVDVHDLWASGGSGTEAAAAFFYEESLDFGLTNAYLQSSGSGRNDYAIVSSSENSWTYYAVGTELLNTDKNHFVRITIKKPWLHFAGNGGTRNGEANFSLQNEFPAFYDLSEYLFTREGHVQVNWRASNGDLVPINSGYLPTENDRLTAQWLRAEPGDLIFNACGGTLPGGDNYTSVMEPTPAPQPELGDYALLGWCTEMNPRADGDAMYSGRWYGVGSEVTPDPQQVTVLYAILAQGVNAVYHANGGQLAQGSDLLVQGSATATDLLVYAPEADMVREGYTFTGWNTEPDGSGRTIQPLTALSLGAEPVLHLYAQWEPIVQTEQVGNVTFRLNPVLKTVEITAPRADLLVAAAYDGQRQRTAAVGKETTVTLTYTGDAPTRITLFRLRSDHSPADKPVSWELEP